jgi:hypothetical protein
MVATILISSSTSLRIRSTDFQKESTPATFLRNLQMNVTFNGDYNEIDNEDLYTTALSLGNPSQTINGLILDTGTPYLWIPSKPGLLNNSSQYFNCGLSNTCKNITNITEAYSDYQGVLYGNVKEDFITVSNGATSISQEIILVSSIEGTYGNEYLWMNPLFVQGRISNLSLPFTFPIGGVLGLGINPDPDIYTSFLDNLYNQGQISNKTFSIFMNSNPITQSTYTEAYFGGIDSQFASTPFHVTPALIETQTWAFGLKASYFYLGNVSLGALSNPNPVAVLASGLNYILLPEQDFQSFYSELSKDYKCNYTMGSIQCECNFDPDLELAEPYFPSISFSGVDGYVYTINSNSYVNNNMSLSICTVLIGSNTNGYFQVQPEYADTWLLGAPFFENYYTVFNYSGNQDLAFATFAPPVTVMDLVPSSIAQYCIYGAVGLLGLWAMYRFVKLVYQVAKHIDPKHAISNTCRWVKMMGPKLVAATADPCSHIVAVILIVYDVVVFNNNFQKYPIANESGTYIYLNTGSFQFLDKMNLTILANNSIFVENQQCLVYQDNSSTWQPGYNDAITQVGIVGGIAVLFVIHVVKYIFHILQMHGTNPQGKKIAFCIQNATFGALLLTSFITKADTSYCYGLIPLYMATNGTMSLWVWYTYCVNLALLLLVLGLVAIAILYSTARRICQDHEKKHYDMNCGQCTGSLLSLMMFVLVVVGLYSRVLTYWEGLGPLWAKFYLAGDILNALQLFYSSDPTNTDDLKSTPAFDTPNAVI